MRSSSRPRACLHGPTKNGGAQAADTHADIRFLSRSSCCYQPTTKRRTNGNMRPSHLKRTPLDNINLKKNTLRSTQKTPAYNAMPSVDTVAGCGWLHALPRSLRAPPPSNVVRLFFVPPPSAGMMGIAATSTLEGGGAQNTSVWDNLTLLVS